MVGNWPVPLHSNLKDYISIVSRSLAVFGIAPGMAGPAWSENVRDA
jgi:hypothetical protein